jgi:PAS domain S-box-containing protein
MLQRAARSDDALAANRHITPTMAKRTEVSRKPAQSRPPKLQRLSRAPRELSPDHAEIDHASLVDDAVPARLYQAQAVVGLGGSAGSIKSLQKFFSAMPPDTGLAFVVILHLSPEHESALPQVLQRSTSMHVVQVNAAAKLKPNCVYVIPPGKQLAAADGTLEVADLPNERGRRVAVDLFFRTLADTHGPQSTAIVLSGADGDGAIGIKRIKERGGLTIAQDPDEAEHPAMPQSAIATGMVDWVLQVDAMPARLMKYHETGRRVKLPPEEPKDAVPPHDGGPARTSVAQAEAALREVLTFLHRRTGHDFSYYKRATILRRIRRRLQVNAIDELPMYLEFLRTHPGETTALLQDLLISVTNFFRDREAFEALAAEIPALLRSRAPNDPVRVWVAGCASGEEAYSIAILLSEYARLLDTPPTIQIFATDLNEDVIKTARDGLYPEAITADVSEERLRRWFIKEQRGYRVRREIRELVLFALHDLLKDSPFSRVDLVSCRNLFIYLKPEAQSRALDIFHFALRGNGRLFLGVSELVDSDNPRFTVIDKKYRVYARKEAARTSLPVPIGASALARLLEAKEKAGEAGPHKFNDEALHRVSVLRDNVEREWSSSELHYRLIERFAPPSVVVTATHDIVHLSDSVGRFLRFSGGEPATNLLKLVHPALRVDLRAALFSAAQSKQPASAINVPMADGEPMSVDIHVASASDLAPEHLLVTFEAHNRSAPPQPNRERSSQQDAVVQHMEHELETTRSQLRLTVDQAESSTSELKATNEELQAMNEELRSATEELETSREELESINEELTSVNLELKARVDELSSANSDLNNLMAATAIATIFLDRNLCITRYTPSAVALFNLIPTDLGRPLTDLTHRLDYREIERDARRALDDLIPTEREVQGEGRWYLARTGLYRSVDERIGGVVFTFVDITARKQAEEALRELQQEQAADLVAILRLQEVSSRLLSMTDLPLLLRQLLDATIEMQHASMGCVQLYDRDAGKLNMVAHRGFDQPVLDRLSDPAIDKLSLGASAMTRRERIEVFDVNEDESFAWLRDIAAQAGFRSVQSTPLIDRNDQPLGVLTTHFGEPRRLSQREQRLTDLYARQAADVIALKLAEQNLRESEEHLRAIVDQTALGVAQCTFNGQFKFANQRMCELAGRSAEQLYRLRFQDITHPDDQARNEKLFARLARDGTPFEIEKRLVRPDHSEIWVSVSVSVLRDRNGRPHSATAVLLDLTERNRARAASRESAEQLKLVVENAREYAIFSTDLARRITSWNSGAQRLIGYNEKEAVGMSADVIFTPEDVAADVPELEANTALTEGRSADERWHVRKDGTRFWGSGSMMAMHDASNRTIGLLKIFRDETQVRAATEALAQSRAELEQALRDNKIARDELEAASRAKDRFLAVLSHELRTPLTPVVMAVHTLSRRDDLPDTAREALEMIRRNVKVESHLIDDLLDLTRISRGHMEILLEPTDLNKAITDAVDVCESDIRGRNQTLTVELNALRHHGDADLNRLQQVIWNLLKNASKFTRRGGEIRVTTRNQGDLFIVSVADNGIGIEPSALPAIFDAFSQGGEWVAREYGGLGLGLAISKATVEAHGGTIRAESAGRGRGATFTVELRLTNP